MLKGISDEDDDLGYDSNISDPEMREKNTTHLINEQLKKLD